MSEGSCFSLVMWEMVCDLFNYGYRWNYVVTPENCSPSTGPQYPNDVNCCKLPCHHVFFVPSPIPPLTSSSHLFTGWVWWNPHVYPFLLLMLVQLPTLDTESGLDLSETCLPRCGPEDPGGAASCQGLEIRRSWWMAVSICVYNDSQIGFGG